MPLVINVLRGNTHTHTDTWTHTHTHAHTHTHTHTHTHVADKNNFKKPGARWPAPSADGFKVIVCIYCMSILSVGAIQSMHHCR